MKVDDWRNAKDYWQIIAKRRDAKRGEWNRFSFTAL